MNALSYLRLASVVTLPFPWPCTMVHGPTYQVSRPYDRIPSEFSSSCLVSPLDLFGVFLSVCSWARLPLRPRGSFNVSVVRFVDQRHGNRIHRRTRVDWLIYQQNSAPLLLFGFPRPTSAIFVAMQYRRCGFVRRLDTRTDRREWFTVYSISPDARVACAHPRELDFPS